MAKVKNPFSSERTILGYSGRGIAAALRVAIPLLTGEQPAPSGVMVRSQIIKANGEPVNVDYMMRRTGDSWLISDIYLDGAISEVATRRSEFATILKSQGIDGLIWSRAARRSKEVGFAMDSPLEGDGFEPSVPTLHTHRFGPPSCRPRDGPVRQTEITRSRPGTKRSTSASAAECTGPPPGGSRLARYRGWRDLTPPARRSRSPARLQKPDRLSLPGHIDAPVGA